MKTTIKLVLAILGLAFSVSLLNAQDYKHPYGLVKEDGKIYSPEGTFLGTVTKDGVIKDTAGVKIAHIDSEGTLVDAKTGKKLGKAQKNGNYISHGANTGDKGWTVSAPMNGTCEVKNAKGETVVVVHENYKQYGACAYHCLTMKKEGKPMKMK